MDREDVDPEDKGRSLLSRAGSITRAERRAARGEAPPPEVQRQLQAPGASVARLERKIFVIGSERCPSVQGWRRGPPENYLKKCDQYHLVPEPKMMQLIQSLHKAKRPELDLKDQRIGDDHALAVMDSMACSDPIHVVVKNCRLKAKGVKAVCDALVAHCTRLEELDMSDNQCRRPKAAKAVAALLDCKGCDSLEKLSLSHCGLASAPALTITSEWAHRVEGRRAMRNLVELHLAKNDLGVAAETLGGLLGPYGAFPMLRLLDLAWTGLHGAGAAAVARGLLQSRIQRCDLSWNCVRGNDPPLEDDCIALLSQSLGEAPKLWHVNLSFNGMSKTDLRRLEAGARASRTLAGLHLGGNKVKDVLDERSSYVNAKRRREAMVAGENNLAEQLQGVGRQGKLLERGRDHLNMDDNRDSKESNSLGDAITSEIAPGPFLVNNDEELDDDQYLYTRIIGTKDVPQSLEWTRSKHCWICERWHEIRFAWTPGRSDSDVQPASRKLIQRSDVKVSCRCAFDDWRPHLCEKVKKSHQVWLLVPPGDRQYTFELSSGKDIVTEAASDAGREVLHKKNLEAALWAGAFDNKDEDEGLITNVHSVPPGDWDDVQFIPIPEKQAVVVKQKPKEAWTWQKSLFAPAYEGAYEHPFEKDWELAHCDKLVNDDGSTKALMKANYGEFLSVYKLFCSNNKAIFTLGWNDFTDFTVSADLEVKRKADADMVFFGCCTTGPKNPHLNPKKSLCRFQFLDACMKLAMIKWFRTKEVATPLEAAQKLVERVAPLVPTREEQDDFHARVWREDVEDSIKHDMDNLKRAFKTHSGREDALSKHKMCSFGEWQDMCESLNFVDPTVGFTERDVNLCFLRATRTPDDELHDEHAPHRKLDWVHWIEALMRVGDRFSESENVDLEPYEACIQLFERVAYEYPSGAEKRRRAKLAAELDRKQKEEKAAEARRPSVEENASKPPKLSAILKGARGLGAFKKKA